MNDLDNSVPALGRLLDQRMTVVRMLANSLEASRLALVERDTEAIARGAAHQAELCRQWSQLEDELRAESMRRRTLMGSARTGGAVGTQAEKAAHSLAVEEEWAALRTRIQYLTRVHWSLLRHMQRSLAILERMVASCAATYRPPPGVLNRTMHVQDANLQDARMLRAQAQHAPPRTGE